MTTCIDTPPYLDGGIKLRCHKNAVVLEWVYVTVVTLGWVVGEFRRQSWGVYTSGDNENK